MISYQQIFSSQVLTEFQNLLEENVPNDGTGVKRSFLLKKSGLIESLVADGMLPNVALQMRELSTEEFENFKSGKKLPVNFPFPPEDQLPIDLGRDLLGRYYLWYKEIKGKLEAAADLLITIIDLGLNKKFESKRGPSGGICRVSEESVNSSNKKSAKGEVQWSDKGLPENFIELLQETLNKHIPLGTNYSFTAKQIASFMGLKLELAPKISDAIRLKRVAGFCSKQKKGITRENSAEKQIVKKPSEVEVTADWSALNFEEQVSSEDIIPQDLEIKKESEIDDTSLDSEVVKQVEEPNESVVDNLEDFVKEPLEIINT